MTPFSQFFFNLQSLTTSFCDEELSELTSSLSVFKSSSEVESYTWPGLIFASASSLK
jgi:hypothetical protein